MNITFVSDSVYPYHKGGKEKRLFELSTRLAARGHDVHIYTMHWWDSAELTQVENGVQLHAISKLYPLYKGETRSIKEGIMFGLACLKLFRVKFEVLDVDHMPFFPIYSAWFVCVLRGKKMNATWHEALSRKDWTSYMGPAGNIAALIERVSIHLPHNISAASAHTQRLIQNELKRSKRVRVVSSGIDTTVINKLKPVAQQIDVLYVGRLVKDKNVDVLVKALAIVAATQPAIRAVIVGHGVERANVQKLITELKLQEQVSLLEPLPEASDVYAYMKAAHIYALPSVREGFGIVALEAMACGTPVITTDAPANAAKDLIDDGRTGSVITLSADSLAVAIEHWLTQPKPKGLATEMAAYDWDAITTQQLEVYSS